MLKIKTKPMTAEAKFLKPLSINHFVPSRVISRPLSQQSDSLTPVESCPFHSCPMPSQESIPLVRIQQSLVVCKLFFPTEQFCLVPKIHELICYREVEDEPWSLAIREPDISSKTVVCVLFSTRNLQRLLDEEVVYTRSFLCVHVCIYVWRPQGDIGYHSSITPSLNLKSYLMCYYCTCSSMSTCNHQYMEVRGELSTVGSCLSPWIPGTKHSSSSFCDKLFEQLTHQLALPPDFWGQCFSLNPEFSDSAMGYPMIYLEPPISPSQDWGYSCTQLHSSFMWGLRMKLRASCLQQVWQTEPSPQCA